ncbi:MAG: hypothetical protein KAW02_02840 [candidate division Zixibacteria bacterium]|nr:hypothetical protein [candidate division Zixibacteria bacterium]
MKLKLRDILLMLLKASGERISGKTKIQKECYLLSQKLHKNFQFRAHYYGPYSPVVNDSLSELVGIGFVEEKKLPWGVDNKGFEAVRYDYELTKEGKEMANLLKRADRQTYRQIKNLVKTLEQLNDPDYMQLSAASKAYFILRNEGKKMTSEEIKQKAKDFNWNLKGSDIHKAVEILEQLAMIRDQC